MLNCAIVDDDLISATVTEGLAKRSGMLNVSATFTSPREALQWFGQNPIDLLFLDMEMPDISGLELLRSLPTKPDVIITSGNTEYAFESYEYVITDYLVKPIVNYGRFLNAVQRVSLKQSKKTEPERSLFVREGSLLIKIRIDDILLIEAFGDYIKIQTLEKVYTVYSSLRKIEEKLTMSKFIRVHRSFIVNSEKISNIDTSNLEISKRVIPISTNYKPALMELINIL